MVWAHCAHYPAEVWCQATRSMVHDMTDFLPTPGEVARAFDRFLARRRGELDALERIAGAIPEPPWAMEAREPYRIPPAPAWAVSRQVHRAASDDEAPVIVRTTLADADARLRQIGFRLGDDGKAVPLDGGAP